MSRLPPNPYSSRNPGGYGQVDPRMARGPSPAQQGPPAYSNQQPGGYPRGGDPRYGDPRAAPRSRATFVVDETVSAEAALSGFVYASPGDFADFQHVAVRSPQSGQQFIVTLKQDVSGKVQPGSLGMSSAQRTWMSVAKGDAVNVEPVEGLQQLGILELHVGWFRRGLQTNQVFSVDKMVMQFRRAFQGQVFSTGQSLIAEVENERLQFTVQSVQVLEGKVVGEISGGSHSGILIPDTQILIGKAKDSQINLQYSAQSRQPNKAVISPTFKFEDMGIGGLDAEFGEIFRRAFASRVFPPDIVQKLGIPHVKGLLLYGPPGTGKTLMARQIGKVLNSSHEPKVVNGPEILSKFVGASEENIRKLFADAEKEFKEKGNSSELHIIIFDEIDAICKQRGSTSGGTGVGDSVVNQLLSKMDGVDQLNNILIIGMTNRLDMIDEALLRPGRLEVHMEVSLPDEAGRLQILKIHTATMRKSNMLDPTVDLDELSARTKNFSGAEISGLVKSASSFALNRHVKVGTVAGVSSDVGQLRVQQEDFDRAFNDVKPMFGVTDDEFAAYGHEEIIHYDQSIEAMIQRGEMLVKQVGTSRTTRVSVLLHGPMGSGKTAIAVKIAMASNFPFVKVVSPENMVGLSESGKVAAIAKIFMDSYKSPLSVIVVDNFERLLDYSPIGPRYSNTVLQTLLILLSRAPPKKRRLLILVTTSNRQMLVDMGIDQVFDSYLQVHPIRSIDTIGAVIARLDEVSKDAPLFPDRRLLPAAINQLRDRFGKDDLRIGIKKLLSAIEMARQSPDVVDQLAESLSQFVIWREEETQKRLESVPRQPRTIDHRREDDPQRAPRLPDDGFYGDNMIE